MELNAFVTFPDAQFTENLVKRSLQSSLDSNVKFLDQIGEPAPLPLLQWSTYDEISHELTLIKPQHVLASCYSIRKSLIRKHFLHRCVQQYLAKHPESILTKAVPKTWDLEIIHADELDEMWVDELYDLGQVLPDESEAEDNALWFILKPGMADRGMGIRLFKSRVGLQSIFESFEDEEGSDVETDEQDTSVVASQLRHFVIQEYLEYPVLFDPTETLPKVDNKSHQLIGKKFHLRAYCVAQGALNVFLFPRMLALFSSSAYNRPTTELEGASNISAHLTNTALQESHGEENVRLLQELVGCTLLSGSNRDSVLTQADIERLTDNVAEILAEIFKPSLDSPIHFQTLPNAFELFGADFLVTHDPESTNNFRVSILELNAEPAVHLTGPRLSFILDELFVGITKVCVNPFFWPKKEEVPWRVGETRHGLRCCLLHNVRGEGGW